MSRIKGKQLAKHLRITGSLQVSGSESPHENGAAIDIIGGVNASSSENENNGIIDAGTFVPTVAPKVIIP